LHFFGISSTSFVLSQYAKIVESLKTENSQLKEKVVALEEEIETLKTRVSKFGSKLIFS